jgi:hypothetical protein
MAAALLAACAFDAAAETPAQKAVGEAASAYAQDLAFKPRLPILREIAFNAPPAEIRAALADARAAVVAEEARIRALAPPTLRAPGIDLSFVADALRADAIDGLGKFEAAFAEVDVALAAQGAGDCAGMTARIEAMRNKAFISPAGMPNSKRRVLESFLGEFAGGIRLVPMVATPSPEEQRERAINAMTLQLSQRLRCPLAPAAERLLIDVRLAPGRTLVVTLPDAPQDVRERVMTHLQGLTLPGYPGAPHEMYGQTLRFEWAEQRVRLRQD